jgi:zinc protease
MAGMLLQVYVYHGNVKPVLLILLASGLALAQHPASRIPQVKFTDTTLDNGLRVIVSEDHYAPIYAIAVSYKVGSRDERKGRTGFAHLFEHMMFKGSQNVGPGELDYLIYTNGGNLNGTTNTDRTLYFEVLPKNQLDLGLFLEADRMRGLVITQENLENQRQAVKEERRLRVDNQPYGPSEERLEELIYDNFAYHHSVIGSMEDLDAASIDDVKQFFKTYYAPNNAVLALAGDLDTKETLAKVKKYFGTIPRQEPPRPVDLTEPAKTQERREKIDDKLARLARLDIAFRIPEANQSDTRALVVAASILGGGGGRFGGGNNDSRLYQLLVRDKEVAVQVVAATDRRAGPGMLQIEATIRPGKSPAEVESLISEEIAKLHSEPVSQKELDRARLSLRRNAVLRMSVLGRAQALADGAALYNDPNRINTELDLEGAINAAAIQKAVKTYLVASNRVVVETSPGAAAGSRAPRP